MLGIEVGSRRYTLFGALLVLAVIASAAGAGQPMKPRGDETVVNTLTRGTQVGAHVAMDDDGNYVVAWLSYTSSEAHIYARRYSRNGRPIGEQFMVDEVSDVAVVEPSIAMSSSGEFLIAWGISREGYFGPIARVYSPDGTPLTAPFIVGNDPDNPSSTDVDITDDGLIAIVWGVARDREPSGGIRNSDVLARLYNDDGAPLTDEFQVNEPSELKQSTARVAFGPTGTFVVAWVNEKPVRDTYKTEIAARRFDSSGAALGDEVSVSEGRPPVPLMRPEYSQLPSIGVDSKGRYVIAWSSTMPSDGYVAMAHRYDANGEPMGSKYLLRANTTHQDEGMQMAMNDSGRFIAVWDALNEKERRRDRQDVYGALFQPNGKRIGSVRRLNKHIKLEQFAPDAAVTENWHAVVVWSRYRAGTYNYDPPPRYDVYQRSFSGN